MIVTVILMIIKMLRTHLNTVPIASQDLWGNISEKRNNGGWEGGRERERGGREGGNEGERRKGGREGMRKEGRGEGGREKRDERKRGKKVKQSRCYELTCQAAYKSISVCVILLALIDYLRPTEFKISLYLSINQ